MPQGETQLKSIIATLLGVVALVTGCATQNQDNPPWKIFNPESTGQWQVNHDKQVKNNPNEFS